MTFLAGAVQQDGRDIVMEMKLQDLFGVSMSYEMSLPKTDRDVAMRMLEHSGAFHKWHGDAGYYYDWDYFELNGNRHHFGAVVLEQQCYPCMYHVFLRCGNAMLYDKYGDNLARLIWDMLEQERWNGD